MVYVVCYLVAMIACFFGTICGMGGGIIIKPSLDMLGVMSVKTITFLSGCTVIAMTTYSVTKSLVKKESTIEIKNTSILAVGAVIGGLLGNELFKIVAAQFADPNKAGGVQSLLLLIATGLTLIYTLKKEYFKPKHLEKPAVIIILGICLGALGSFIGIGGGPFNVAALYYFFDMEPKKAAQNSLYIVLFSQVSSIIKTIITSGIPEFSIWILVGMAAIGIVGSELGRRVNKKLSSDLAVAFLVFIMIVVMIITTTNMVNFLY